MSDPLRKLVLETIKLTEKFQDVKKLPFEKIPFDEIDKAKDSLEKLIESTKEELISLCMPRGCGPCG
jgi:hypothetical protein